MNFNNTIQIIKFYELNSKDVDLIKEYGYKIESLSQIIEYDFIQYSKKNRRDPLRLRKALDFKSKFLEKISIKCPIQNTNIQCSKTLLSKNNKNIFYYYFKSNVEYILIIGDTWNEIIGLYTIDFCLLILFVDSREKLNTFLNDLYTIKEQLNNNFENSKTILIIKKNHFAHHIWNELSELEKLDNNNLSKNVNEICILSEPVIPLKEIFPHLKSKMKYFTSYEKIYAYVNNGSFYIHPLGDVNIPSKVIGKITHLHYKYYSEKYSYLNTTNNIWISFKDNSRTIQNQSKLLFNIIKTFNAKVKDVHIIIDYYSRNYHALDLNYKQSKGLLLLLKLLSKNKIKCLLIHKIKHLEAMHIASKCCFFFVHQGTLHHKIDWFSNAVGYIHSNKYYTDMDIKVRPGFWENYNISAKYVVKSKYIKDVATHVTARNRRTQAKHMLNYKILNENNLIKEMVNRMNKSIIRKKFNEINKHIRDRKHIQAFKIWEEIDVTNSLRYNNVSKKLAKLLIKKSEYDKATSVINKISEVFFALDYHLHLFKAIIGANNKNKGVYISQINLCNKVLNSNNELKRTNLIQHLITNNKYKTYLEIGVCRGFNFLPLKISSKTAVDPNFKIPHFSLMEDETTLFYETESDTFFDKNKLTYDIIFIDGLHTFRQSLNDTLNALNFLNPNGIILIHDCFPGSFESQLNNLNEAYKADKFTGAWTGDVWKSILYLQKCHKSELDISTLNFDHGIGVIKFKENRNKDEKLTINEHTYNEINELSYDYFANNYKQFLNLKDYSLLKSIFYCST